ncbi:hypothetical protein QOZ80_5BG0432900 [Eleusine coracana subsp. coracana]|nr:hypothetical protein QOZ80_5BG0432900 [Eleusine coracana subsp. coracana]
MDPLGVLAVRFHYGGVFLAVDHQLQYFGGNTGMSHIEVDKLSLPEVKGHLRDHMPMFDVVKLHWLFPGGDLDNGLSLLYTDNACNMMAQHITDGGVADIYVEEVDLDNKKLEEDNTGYRDEVCEADDEAEEMDVEVPCSMPTDVVATPVKNVADKDFYKSPSSKSPRKVTNDGDMADQEGKVGDQSESSDDDYQPNDLNSSGDDEEAEQLQQFAKQIKKNNRAKKLGESRSQALIHANATVPKLNNLEEDGSPYLNSSDDYSYEEHSEGKTTRWKTTENRFDTEAPVPMFALGMAFRRVIGLDGCFFKGATNGELLCAIGRDANNQMYPIAWASVEKETYDSWYWFLGLLQKDLKISVGGEGWVLISDQQKGLMKSVAELVPKAEHRMCARHIYANWRKKHSAKTNCCTKGYYTNNCYSMGCTNNFDSSEPAS